MKQIVFYCFAFVVCISLSSCETVLEILSAGFGSYPTYNTGYYGGGTTSSYSGTSSVSGGGSSSTVSYSSTRATSQRICPSCKGSGKCIGCHGSGHRTDNSFGTGVDPTKKCGVCGGKGICGQCKGVGKI